MARGELLVSPDGTRFRDLDHDGIMAPFEDPRRSPEERADDLVGRLSLAEKAGLVLHNIIECGPDGSLVEGDGFMPLPPTTEVVTGLFVKHVNVHALPDARTAARWANALQDLAATTPHSIPVTISTDPRHGFAENVGAAFAAGAMSQWPEPIGLAALGDVERIREFADVARREYLAVGIRAALHPQIDLATEPRWARQNHTFGADWAFAAEAAAAYVEGFQGDSLGPESVATMAKHFPGAGPQLDGEDAHFPYGREQVYPGGRFAEHLAPFRRALAAGTAAIMPYYAMPVGLELDGEAIEEVGFGFNRQILTGLLRDELGYDGVICTDWGLVTDVEVMGTPMPARAWGVEHLSRLERVVKIFDAGADQLGGEFCADLVMQAVTEGLIAPERLDESVRRLLLVKFRLGLFDDPFVDEDAAAAVVGVGEFVAAGLRAQAESTVLLANDGVLPLDSGLKVYAEGFEVGAVARLGELVTDPVGADVAVVRLPAPFEPREDIFLEAMFHQGSLDYRPGLVWRLRQLAAQTRLVIVADLERPGILGPLAEVAAAVVGGFGVSDTAVVDVLTGAVPPRGSLPFEIPASMAAVRESLPDVPHSAAPPLYPAGHGLRYG